MIQDLEQDLHVLPFLWQLKYHSGQNKVLPYSCQKRTTFQY
jgi:hypothetical protein